MGGVVSRFGKRTVNTCGTWCAPKIFAKLYWAGSPYRKTNMIRFQGSLCHYRTCLFGDFALLQKRRGLSSSELHQLGMVARGRIELPTRGFSVRCSTN